LLKQHNFREGDEEPMGEPHRMPQSRQAAAARPGVGDDAPGHATTYRAGGAPITNIRNTSSPHWRMWLKPESRYLVPANSFAEYAPEPNPETARRTWCPVCPRLWMTRANQSLKI